VTLGAATQNDRCLVHSSRLPALRKGTYTPMDVNWMPGGRQPIAVHHATGRIYVLMHMANIGASMKRPRRSGF